MYTQDYWTLILGLKVQNLLHFQVPSTRRVYQMENHPKTPSPWEAHSLVIYLWVVQRCVAATLGSARSDSLM